MSRRHKSRINSKGRNSDRIGREERYLSLRRSIWNTPQVSALSTNARALMIELLSMFNGRNNGALFLGARDATERLGFASYQPALDAFNELESVGLISNTVGASFRIKAGEGCLARAWRLNWLGDDGKRIGPEALKPLDMKRLAKKARARLAKRQTALKRFEKDLAKGNFSVEDTVTRPSELGGGAFEQSATQFSENGAIPAIDPAKKSATHILHQGGPGAGVVCDPAAPNSRSEKNDLVLLRGFAARTPRPVELVANENERVS